MKKLFLILIAALAVSLYSCEEDAIGQYPVEFTPPGAVSNVTYESLPGAVKLTYTLPTDKDLLYVKATYYLDNGSKMEASASSSTNELLIDGYGNGDSLRTVHLVAVDLNQNKSTPITVRVMPLESPIYNVMDSLVANKDFGGIYLKWKNPLKAKIIVVVTTPDAAGKPVVTIGGKFYSSIAKATVNVRGYDSIPRSFYIQVMDRWGNKTKMDTVTVTPIFERMIPKTYHLKWNGDPTIPYQEYGSGNAITKLWDNIWGSTSGGNCYSTRSGGGLSTSLTYDLNSQANNSTGKGWINPSRMKMYARSGSNFNYKVWGEYVRIWGSTSPNVSTANSSGPDAWILLGENPAGYHITPPSGKSGLQATAEDIYYAEEQGYDVIFPPGMPPIRYVRIETISKWDGGTPTTHNIGEVTWYGNIQ